MNMSPFSEGVVSAASRGHHEHSTRSLMRSSSLSGMISPSGGDVLFFLNGDFEGEETR